MTAAFNYVMITSLSEIVMKKPVGDLPSRLAAIIEFSDDAIISKTLDGVIRTWNPAAERLFNYSAQEAIGQPITLIIPTELRNEEKEILRRIRAGERIEHYETRRITRDGRVLDVSLTISPIRNDDGVIVGASKILRDITDSKHARAALATVKTRLIDAQQEERARIARELHDDISQRLAMLSVRLDALAKAAPAWPDGRRDVEEVRDEVSNLARDVQALSHRLHPARLEYLGIVGAADALCREMSSQQRINVDFRAESVPEGLSRDLALCLYRILQEALQNAVKHSGADGIEVLLRGNVDRIELTIHDGGTGFDAHALERKGLGLTSMKERLMAVHGTLAIESALQRGTTIRARVPLPPH
jgi:PAS domain S-box-containing protein